MLDFVPGICYSNKAELNKLYLFDLYGEVA